MRLPQIIVSLKEKTHRRLLRFSPSSSQFSKRLFLPDKIFTFLFPPPVERRGNVLR